MEKNYQENYIYRWKYYLQLPRKNPDEIPIIPNPDPPKGPDEVPDLPSEPPSQPFPKEVPPSEDPPTKFLNFGERILQ